MSLLFRVLVVRFGRALGAASLLVATGCGDSGGGGKTGFRLFHAAGGVDELLLARVERVAGRAQFRADFFLRGTGHEVVATGTGNLGRVVHRVDVVLHNVFVGTERGMPAPDCLKIWA